MEPWLIALSVAGGAVLGALATRILLRGASDDSASAPLAAIAEHLPIAVLLFTVDGRIRFANRRAHELLSAGEPLQGRNFLRLLANAPPEVAHALAGSTDALFSLNEDGNQQTFQMLRRDIDLDGSAHVLLLINALTREVARREVDVLKKVIRVINHELNNSLATMSSLVSSGRFIVENPDKLKNLGRVLDGIDDRTEHLQRFLSEYAQLSRLPKPRAAEVQWAPLLARLQTLYPDAQVGTPPPGPGWFDEVQVEQALINLLKNATEAGGSATEVRVVIRALDDSVEVGVLDRGTGFSHEALQQGLLPFYSTKEQGSGVGLALCREVADGHQGSLRIKNREGGGSAVYLVLPAGPDDSEPNRTLVLTLTST